MFTNLIRAVQTTIFELRFGSKPGLQSNMLIYHPLALNASMKKIDLMQKCDSLFLTNQSKMGPVFKSARLSQNATRTASRYFEH